MQASTPASTSFRLSVLASAMALAATIYRFPPTIYSFYPVCPFHQYTGLLCPGCGATRAISALLHGHLAEAIHLNALFVCGILPAVIIYAVMVMNRKQWIRVSPLLAWAVTSLALLFTIQRNLS